MLPRCRSCSIPRCRSSSRRSSAINSPPAPRNDLVTIFLKGIPGLNQPPKVKPSEMLRLNVAIPPSASPNPLGVLGGDLAGFPNGRRVGDDVTDAALRVMAGATPLTPAFNTGINAQLTRRRHWQRRAVSADVPVSGVAAVRKSLTTDQRPSSNSQLPNPASGGWKLGVGSYGFSREQRTPWIRR